mgnify:CR=1 FL=1
MDNNDTLEFYIFLDESGDHGLRNIDPGFPVFVLCATLFSVENYEEARDKMNTIKQKFWDNKDVIMHSVDIRKWRDAFQILINQDIREEFLTLMNSMMTDSKYTVIASAVKKEDFIKRYGKLHTDIYEVCLSFIIERLIFYLDDINIPNKNVSLIIECRGKKEDNKLKANFNRLMQVGTGFVSPERLKNINLSIHFRKKSQNINGLQFADLVAYPIARYVLDMKKANPAFEIIRPHIYSKNNRLYGLKISP